MLRAHYELLKQNKTYGPKPNPPNWICEKGEGIFIVSKIRNKLAHGNYKISDFPDQGFTKNYDLLLINNCTRLVLFTMQMFFSYQLLESPNHSNSDDVDTFSSDFFPTSDYLLNLHLKSNEN